MQLKKRKSVEWYIKRRADGSAGRIVEDVPRGDFKTFNDTIESYKLNIIEHLLIEDGNRLWHRVYYLM